MTIAFQKVKTDTRIEVNLVCEGENMSAVADKHHSECTLHCYLSGVEVQTNSVGFFHLSTGLSRFPLKQPRQGVGDYVP